jgi:hypothetical protein
MTLVSLRMQTELILHGLPLHWGFSTLVRNHSADQGQSDNGRMVLLVLMFLARQMHTVRQQSVALGMGVRSSFMRKFQEEKRL